ncbi:MAG: glycosyltransferase [Chitinophagaceae bacterium]|nr:glycosyltransferase [Chitinophagaceae bacterium]
MTVFLITAVLLAGYCGLILYYYNAWRNIPVFDDEKITGFIPSEKVTVIVPARNEEPVIEKCIQSLLAQSYPKHLMEIIVADDHSADNTAAIVSAYQSQGITLLVLAETVQQHPIKAHKKKAIEEAVRPASGTLIITTDADCTAGTDWVKAIAAFHAENDAVFIAAPVKMVYTPTFLSIFQAMDFAILQGITAASVSAKFHNMCNGANLAYEKKAFEAVNGFTGIDDIASGDDMLLMHKMNLQFPGKVAFLHSPKAVVKTLPAKTWGDFFQQRIRWASKAGRYRDIKITLVLCWVYLVNLALLILLAGSIWDSRWLLFFVIALFYKTIIEWGFVKSVLRYFDMLRLLPLFPLFQPFHILYTVLAGFLGSFGKYTWKGRNVK